MATDKPKMEYLGNRDKPKMIPGKRLVHNPVHAVSSSQRPGTNGFRVFYVGDDFGPLTECKCGWEPSLVHYRTNGPNRAVPAQGSATPCIPGGSVGITECDMTDCANPEHQS